MVFSSVTFLCYFLPAFLLVYFVLPQSRTWGQRSRNLWLLAASVFFYAWGAPQFIGILLASTVVDFYLVQKMSKTQVEKKRKGWLLASLFLNLGLLATFKYAGFFAENAKAVGALLGGSGDYYFPDIALPIGISFYTFQTLTYALDVYRRSEQPLEHLSDYLVYILSFPQMIAGPIVRFGQVASELRKRSETWEDRLHGAYRFCLGLAKKVLIANALAEHADRVFDGPLDALSTGMAWTGLCAYTFQIYFDFSGYSDMAIGLGRMMGFHFPENFKSPYTARSITEFWRRWHITLGDFMRNYLYIPLGGNRKGLRRTYINLVVVFVLSGLWHGASWNFVAWGVFHGAFLVMDRLFLERCLMGLPLLISVGLTFVVTMMGWVLFRMESNALDFYLVLLGGRTSGEWTGTPGLWVYLAVAAFFSGLAMTNWGAKWERRTFESTSWSLGEHIAWTAGSTLLFLASLSTLVSDELNPFIYFRF